MSSEHWSSFTDAIEFAVSRVVDDRDPVNERELADGQQYVSRLLHALSETSLVPLDFERPSFMAMRESVRHLGAAGPDIDYDVAVVLPGRRYRITGIRGDASYVGIVVYGSGGAQGATSILESVDVDTLVDAHGRFTFDVEHAEAGRVIIRQYFHDRAMQQRGAWEISIADTAAGSGGAAPLPDVGIVGHRVANSADMLRWNAQLNQLWTPERRDHPNEFIPLSAEDIVAAIPNPDVSYSFTWWRIGDGEALVVDAQPPDTRYWAVQLCDRWFQSYPHRRTNLNDRQVKPNADGSIRVVIAGDGVDRVNQLDTSGHTTGVVFFRWLHAEPPSVPTCRIVDLDQID